MLDSLVRVSRRVDGNHFVRIVMTHSIEQSSTNQMKSYNIVVLTSFNQQEPFDEASRRVITSSIQSMLELQGLTGNCLPYLPHSLLTRTELILTRMPQLKMPTIRPGIHAGLTTTHTTDPMINTKIVAYRLVSSASLLTISSTF